MPSASPPLVTVILVNYNGREHLRRCLPVLNSDELDGEMEIIIVDNGSQDGSREFIRRLFPDILLLVNRKNLGFGAANNRGAASARGEYLLFLNTDTEVFPGALRRLMQVLRSDKNVGAAGPALVQEGGRMQVSCGGRVNFLTEMWKKLLGNSLSAIRMKECRKEKDVKWLSGACLLVRRAAWEQVSGFDESFFLYFEDIDLCYRLEKQGWTMRYVPAARVFHQGGASTETMGMESRLYYRSSQVIFYSKHNRGLSQELLKLYLKMEYCFLTLFGWRRGRENLRSLYRKLLKEIK
jgi:GT2 family glycosyltransferase